MKIALIFFLTLFNSFSYGSDCPKFQAANEFADLLTPISLMNPNGDARKPISTVYKDKDIALSKDEYKQAFYSVGEIFCPPKGDVSGSVAVAFVAGDNSTLVTASHALDSDGIDYVAQEACYFVNYAHPDDRIMLSKSPDDYEFGRKGDFKMRSDYVVIHLSRPVPGAVAYNPDPSNSPIRAGRPIVRISNDLDESFKLGREPKVQACNSTFEFNLDDKKQGAYLTNCDALDGDSGGLDLIRTANGSLAIKGIHSRSTSGDDHCNYDGVKCSSVSTEMVGPFLALVMKRSKMFVNDSKSASQYETKDL